MPPILRKLFKWFLIAGAVLGWIFFLLALLVIGPVMMAGESFANSEQSNITTIAAGIKNAHGAHYDKQGRRDYSGVSDREAVETKIAPRSMIENGEIHSAWGQSVHLFPLNRQMQRTPPYELFTISYMNMPSADCVKLVPGLIQNCEAIFIGTKRSPFKTGKRLQSVAEVAHACGAAEAVNVDFVLN